MKSKTLFITASILFVGLGIPCLALAADDKAVAATAPHLTLWSLLKAGGWTMIVLGLLSVTALTMVFYNFLTLKQELLVPTEFTDNLIMRLEAHDLQGARIVCEKKKNIMTSIALAGINRFNRGKMVIREVMTKAMEKEITRLWKSISFLGDIVTIAPLLGLLGTTIGMIQAFNVITSAGTALKPIMLVGGISKALVTTAAGLIIAVPTLAFYSYFRGVVQDIVDVVEDYATDIIKLIEESPSFMTEPPMKLPPLQSSRESDIQEVLSNA